MKFVYVALTLLALAALTACGGKMPNINVQTPYGNYDSTTSGTVDLDLRPYLPAPKSYNLDQQLEK